MADKSNDNLGPIGKALTKLEQPDVIMKMIYGLAGFCALLLIADFFHLRHGKFESEDLIGFYAFFGFLAFAFIIFATKVLKNIIGRREDYYAPHVIDTEDYPEDELDVKEHGDA